MYTTLKQKVNRKKQQHKTIGEFSGKLQDFYFKKNHVIVFKGILNDHIMVSLLSKWTSTGRLLEKSGRNLNLLRQSLPQPVLCQPFQLLLSKSEVTERTRHIFNKVTLYYIRVYKSANGPTQTHIRWTNIKRFNPDFMYIHVTTVYMCFFFAV